MSRKKLRLKKETGKPGDRAVWGFGEFKKKEMLFPVLMGGGNIDYKFAMGTGTYNEGPILEFARIVEVEDGWGYNKAERLEEDIGCGHMPKRIGLKLANRDSVMPSHILVEWGDRETKAALKLSLEEGQVTSRGEVGSMLGSWDNDIRGPRDIPESAQHGILTKSKF